MSVNISAEMAIFLNRSHPSMILMNTIAYSLELVYYLMATIFVPAYMILSRFGSRFHPLLRFQLRLLFIEVIVIIITREFGVIFRLIEGAAIVLPLELSFVRDVFTNVNLATLNQVDLSVFLIAVERLLATYRIKTYEREFHHPIFRIILIPPNAVFCYFVFIFLNTTFLTFWNYATTVTYFIGIVAMETSRILSTRQLRSDDRELSTSFQCKENIMVVKMFRPIFILFFVARLIQFFAKYYVVAIEAQYGAIPLRIMAHIYNQSVGICFCLLPLMLLKNHSNLTSFTRQSAIVHQTNADVYFQHLMDKWQNQS